MLELNRPSKYGLLWGISLSILGFYTFLLILNSVGLIAVSRQFSIPFRIVISLLFFLGFVWGRKVEVKPHLLFFLCYFFIILIRILIDVFNNEPYYISYPNLILFLFSFCIVPYLSISSVSLTYSFYNRLYNYFLFFSLVFASVATLNLKDFVGEVSRLNASAVGEEVISPLILSYCSTLCIGIAASFFISKSRSSVQRNVSIIVLLLSIVPFFLGASRGALVALFVSIFSYFVIKHGIKSILYGLGFFIVVAPVIYYLEQYMGTGLLERFFSTSEGIEQGNDSAIRLEIWKTSLKQFMDNPIFGDRLQMNFSDHHPHNIFVESLQAFGLVGSIPLFILLGMALKRSFLILKYQQDFVWIPFIFIQSLVQYFFSGTLFTAAWIWISLALVFSLKRENSSC